MSSFRRSRLGGFFSYSTTVGSSPLARIMATYDLSLAAIGASLQTGRFRAATWGKLPDM